ncbi:hypothetical protein DFJ74DRAFT_695841 [Hyaloraphidium curvatum]|nr:hypothetical protein DFJ74DRAFT_695841 [Hyaloraphidium curvatum]
MEIRGTDAASIPLIPQQFPGSFTPTEWAALFPGTAGPMSDLAPQPQPLTRAALLQTLPNSLAAAARVQLYLGRLYINFMVFLVVFEAVPITGLQGTVFAFGADQFPAKQRAVDVSMVILYLVAVPVMYYLLVVFATDPAKLMSTSDLQWGRSKTQRDLAAIQLVESVSGGIETDRTPTGTKAKASTDPQNDQEPTMDSYDLAGIARYLQLARTEPDSALLAHDGSDLCPCPARSCVGGLIRHAGPLRFLEMIGRGSLDSSCWFFMVYTPLVSLAARTWTTPWSAFFAAMAVALGPLLYSFPTSFSIPSFGIPSMELTRRLYGRAVGLSLAHFLEKREHALVAGETITSTQEPVHIALHRQLAVDWNSRAKVLGRGKLYLGTLIALDFVCALAYIVASGCLPVWLICFTALHLLDVIRALFIAAASNAAVVDVSREYLLCKTRIQEFLATEDPTQLPSPGCMSLAANERLLTSFADVDLYRGSFVGVRVSYASARGFLAATFTVFVGLWTVLRGFGIPVTADSVCRGP